jgi:transposase
MRAFLATQRDWLVVERLPGYAPELNPVGATRSRFQ